MSPHAEQVRLALCRFVAQRGQLDATDRRLIQAVMGDACGKNLDARPFVNLLLAAIDLRVPHDLLNTSPDRVVFEQDRLAKRLKHELFINSDAADWVVASWQAALSSHIVGGTLQVGAAPVRRGSLRDGLASIALFGDRILLRIPVLCRLVPTESPERLGEATGPELVVDQQNGPHRSIHEALAAATEGTRIRVRAGTYLESISIDRNVEIIADASSGAVKVVSEDDSCLRSRTPHAIVRGIAFQARKANAKSERPAIDLETGRLELVDCRVKTNLGAAVRARGADCDLQLRGCVIEPGAIDGIVMASGARGNIDDCQVGAAVRNGIDLADGADPVVTETRVEGCGNVGIAVSNDARGRFERCRVRNCQTINVMATRRAAPTFRRCDFRDAVSANMLFDERASGTIDRCTITDSAGTGLAIRRASSVNANRTAITANGRAGIVLEDTSSLHLQDCTIDESQPKPIQHAPGAKLTQVGGNLELDTGQLRDPRKTASLAVFRGIVLWTLLAAAAGAVCGWLVRRYNLSLDRSAMVGAAAFISFPILLLVLLLGRPGAFRGLLMVSVAAAVLGAGIGAVLQVSGNGPAIGAALGGILALVFGLIVEVAALARGLSGGARKTVAPPPMQPTAVPGLKPVGGPMSPPPARQ